MTDRSAKRFAGVVAATGEVPIFQIGDRVRVMTRRPVGHYRVPTYLRGKAGVVDAVIELPPSTMRRKPTVVMPDRGVTITASRCE